MKFNEFNNKKTQPDVLSTGIPVDGSFGCQLCPLVADEAEYFQVARLLRWKCPDGHISVIEKFDL